MRSDPIALIVNGEARESRAETLAELIDAENLGEAKVATALNGAFVPARARAAQRLAAGDRIEILSARQGG
jgi:sulfur carrier protein